MEGVTDDIQRRYCTDHSPSIPYISSLDIHGIPIALIVSSDPLIILLLVGIRL
jgi:hypothetical protein